MSSVSANEKAKSHQFPISISMEVRESWDKDAKGGTSILIRGKVVSDTDGTYFVTTVPFRPKNSTTFYRQLILRPVHEQDREKDVLDLIKKGNKVYCHAIFEIRGNKVNESNVSNLPSSPDELTLLDVLVSRVA